MPEDVVANIEETTEPQAETEISFEAFSKLRKEGKIIGNEGGTERNSGGDQWDGEQNKWVNKAPRDSAGRFSKVRESLAQSQRKTEYIQALQAGAVEPNDDMSPEEWALARNRMLANGTNVIKTEFPAEKKPADAGAESNDAEQQELTPEEQHHFAKHEEVMARIAAKSVTDPEMGEARAGLSAALDRGAHPDAVRYLGHCIADVDNPYETFLVLGKNPDAMVTLTSLPPQAMRSVVRELSNELAAKSAAAPVREPAPPKPKPPNPVGARAASSAFDVNDDSTDPETWARLRNEQLAKRRGFL